MKTKSTRYALAWLVMAAQASLAFGATLTVEHLRCEYLENPLGIDVVEPRLSWELRAADNQARGLRQSAYQIHVASSPDLLAAGKPDLWDSGKVASDDSVYSSRRVSENQISAGIASSPVHLSLKPFDVKILIVK